MEGLKRYSVFPESIAKGSSGKIGASCVAQETEDHICTAMHSKIEKSTAMHSKMEKSIYIYAEQDREEYTQEGTCRR